MLKTTKLLTVTVPKPTYRQIKKVAKERNISVSGLVRRAFERFVEEDEQLYSDRELTRLLRRDSLPASLKKELDSLLPPAAL